MDPERGMMHTMAERPPLFRTVRGDPDQYGEEIGPLTKTEEIARLRLEFNYAVSNLDYVSSSYGYRWDRAKIDKGMQRAQRALDLLAALGDDG